MFDILVKFIVLPFVVALIFGFLYYDLWKRIKPAKKESETAS